ncbi:MAG: putative capsid protein [Palkane totivirus]|nr:MAG: putative capsid protein [Palkane totivirus]
MSDSAEKKEEEKKSEENSTVEPLTEELNLVSMSTEVLMLQAKPPSESSEKKEDKVAKKPSAEKKEEKETPKPEETKVEDKPKEEDKMADPATTDGKGQEKKDEEGLHYGTHSVYPLDVMQIDTTQCGVPIGQDTIFRISGSLKTLARRLNWNNDNHAVNFSDVLTWARPYQRSVSWTVNEALDWMLEPVNHVVPTVIQEVEPYIKCKFKAQDYAGVLNNGIPDLNQVMKTARGDSQMSKLVADGLASRVLTNPEVTDVSGFFACGYLFAAHMDFLNAVGIVPQLAARADDTLITANIAAVLPADAAIAIANVERALNDQCLSFRRRNLTATDVQVLVAIALGGVSGATVPPGLQQTPITAYIQWPTRKYLLWDTNDIPLGVRVQLTGRQIRASLAAMAGCLHAYDDMASGFIKAASILVCYPVSWDIPAERAADPAPGPSRPPAAMQEFLRSRGSAGSTWEDIVARTRRTIATMRATLEADPNFGGFSLADIESLVEIVAPLEARVQTPDPVAPNRRGALIHSMLEIKNIQVQKVRGYNPIWDMMKMPRPRDAIDPLLEGDGLVLGGMESDLQMKTGFIIGGLLSVCSGVVWHSINVTGRELNGWASGQGSEISTYMRQILQASRDGITAPYYQMVIGVWQQLISTKMTSTFMRCCSTFSGCDGPIEDINFDGSWWQGTWELSIPYIVEPISISWAYNKWCDYWGYIGPKPRVNFSHDLVVGGAADAEYISFNRDEPKYVAAASSDFPFDFIAYGVIMINIIRQYFDAEEVWPITFREVSVCKAGAGDLGPPREDMWQPDFFADFPLIIAGRMISFDHKRQSVLVPGLTRETLGGNNFYTIVRMGEVVLEGVGIQRDGIVDMVNAPVGGLRLLARLRNLDQGGQGGEGSGRAEN